MNKHEIYQTVMNHLITQNKQANGPGRSGQGVCRYKTREGLKCAIGCLIPDDKYFDEIEGKPVDDLPIKKLDIFYLKGKMDFMRQLQALHDCYEYRFGISLDFLKKAKYIAAQFNIKEAYIPEMIRNSQ